MDQHARCETIEASGVAQPLVEANYPLIRLAFVVIAGRASLDIARADAASADAPIARTARSKLTDSASPSRVGTSHRADVA
jgi:hypothetical protein